MASNFRKSREEAVEVRNIASVAALGEEDGADSEENGRVQWQHSRRASVSLRPFRWFFPAASLSRPIVSLCVSPEGTCCCIPHLPFHHTSSSYQSNSSALSAGKGA